MSENLELAYQLALLIGAIVSLIGGLGSVVVGLKAVAKNNKNKTLAELWTKIKTIADKAMIEAESMKATGAEKKDIVISVVKDAMKEEGADIDDFIDQLDAYINNSIAFGNSLKKAEVFKRWNIKK